MVASSVRTVLRTSDRPKTFDSRKKGKIKGSQWHCCAHYWPAMATERDYGLATCREHAQSECAGERE